MIKNYIHRDPSYAEGSLTTEAYVASREEDAKYMPYEASMIVQDLSVRINLLEKQVSDLAWGLLFPKFPITKEREG